MRLFVGVAAPAAHHACLAAATAHLRRLHPAARPAAPGTWHVTLRFLGEQASPGPAVEALGQALASWDAFDWVAGPHGAFPDARRARVVWRGLEAPALATLAARVRGATAHLAPPEAPFVPHLTLARLPAPADVRAALATMDAEPPPPPGRVAVVTLWRSEATAAGRLHTPVASFPAAGAGS